MITAPVATLVVGLVGIAGVLATLIQRSWSEAQDRAHKTRHDQRTEWWRRYQWAAEQVNQQDNERAEEFGRAVISALTDEATITDSERAILRAVADRRGERDTGREPTGGE